MEISRRREPAEAIYISSLAAQAASEFSGACSAAPYGAGIMIYRWFRRFSPTANFHSRLRGKKTTLFICPLISCSYNDFFD